MCTAVADTRAMRLDKCNLMSSVAAAMMLLEWSLAKAQSSLQQRLPRCHAMAWQLRRLKQHQLGTEERLGTSTEGRAYSAVACCIRMTRCRPRDIDRRGTWPQNKWHAKHVKVSPDKIRLAKAS